jgi:hypothetical protein
MPDGKSTVSCLVTTRRQRLGLAHQRRQQPAGLLSAASNKRRYMKPRCKVRSAAPILFPAGLPASVHGSLDGVRRLGVEADLAMSASGAEDPPGSHVDPRRRAPGCRPGARPPLATARTPPVRWASRPTALGSGSSPARPSGRRGRETRTCTKRKQQYT